MPTLRPASPRITPPSRHRVVCSQDPFGVASICRSSQPCVGPSMAKSRSPQDEALLQAIADTNPFNERLQIIDCRPRVNAELNAAKGKGYEHQAQYVNTKLSFMSIENIHVMRSSLRTFLNLLAPRTVAAATKEEDSFLQELDKCGWMVIAACVSVPGHVPRKREEKGLCAPLILAPSAWTGPHPQDHLDRHTHRSPDLR